MTVNYSIVLRNINRVRDLINTDSPLCSKMEIGYLTIVDTGHEWAASFLEGVETEGAWWDHPDEYSYTAKDENFLVAIAKAYDLLLDSLREYVFAYQKLK